MMKKLCGSLSRCRNGVNIAVPVFDSAKEPEIHELFKMAGLKDSQTDNPF